MTGARFIWALIALLTLGVAFVTGGTPGQVALSPVTVVARLGDGPPVSDALQAAMLAQRSAPGDAAQALTAARLMIDDGRARGDSRRVGAALAVLAPFVQAQVPEALLMAATARQYQHDFPGALGLLDRVLAAQPQNLSALLNRATIRTVQGNFTAATQDCSRISALRADVGFLCAATAMTLSPDAPGVAARLSALLDGAGQLDGGLQPWVWSLLGEIAVLQGDNAKAERYLTLVMKDDPGAQRDQLMLADVLLAQGRAAEVDLLLQTAPDTDGVLIRRVLAARAQGRTLAAVEGMLADRAQRSLDLGLVAHAREEAMFFLLIADNPTQALERAQANWAIQHEYDDARLLIRAAQALGQPAAAQPVLDWMVAAKVDIPALNILLTQADRAGP
jgi:tetratricopeptide (TPR) repeat protein